MLHRFGEEEDAVPVSSDSADRGEESCCLTYTAAQHTVRHHPPNYCMRVSARPYHMAVCVCYQVSGSGRRVVEGGGGAACAAGRVCLGEIRDTKHRGTS